MPHSAQLHWDYRDGRVAAVVAAIVYSLWVLEVMLPSGAAQGALADQGSTFARFLESANRTAAILVILAAGLGLGLGARESGHLLTASWWSMVVFGVTSLVATLLPGPCVVSTDVVCTSESLAEGVPGATPAQAVVAVTALLSAMAGVILLALDRRRRHDRTWPLVALLAVLQSVAAVALVVMAVRVHVTSGDGDPGVVFGFTQRAHLVTVALWLLATGLLSGPWRRTRDVHRTRVSG